MWKTNLEPRKQIGYWLLGGCAMVLVILVIGGITRLTQSGLSITEWEPIRGIIPPLSEEGWHQYFEAYRGSPEYQKLNKGMSLHDFKSIFWWEYIHRVAARLFGLGLVIPMIYFGARRWLRGRQLGRAVVLISLVACQGLLGWVMVQSGLGDRPFVGHYQLAGHLGLALVLFGFMLWWALDLLDELPSRSTSSGSPRFLRAGGLGFLAAIFVQCVWGAFVAGLDAGRMVNTFPKMGEHWISPAAWQTSPVWVDMTSNPFTVQLIHRLLALSLVVWAVGLVIASWRSGRCRRLKIGVAVVCSATLIQVVLGVATLLLAVPIALGVLHQLMGFVLFGLALWWVRDLNRVSRP